MSDAAKSPLGKVYLVGAGQGDPGVIAMRGSDRLGQTDVILYDRLANPQLLRFVIPGDSLDYQALAAFPGTLVFQMGKTTAADWTTALIAAGKPINTPAAIVGRCRSPDQVLVRCTLGDVPSRVAAKNEIPAPMVVILGEAAKSSESLGWIGQRPLFGRCVMITRPENQANELADLLEEQAPYVVRQPAIQIGPPADWGPVDAAISNLPAFDWLVFSSSNGVRYLLERLLANGGDLRTLGNIRLAAIGPGTSEALQRYYLRADRLPDTYRAEALAAALADEAPGKRFLLARASRGREVLADQLVASGGSVEQIVVYQSDDCLATDDDIAGLLHGGYIDYTTVTSSAIARSLANMFGDALRKSRLVSISPITSDALRRVRLEADAEARDYTMQGVVDAILRDARERQVTR